MKNAKYIVLTLILTLGTLVICPSLSRATQPCPLSDIGTYKFLERLGYVKYYSDKYEKSKLTPGFNLYKVKLPNSNLIQQNSVPANMFMVVYPDSGKLKQISAIFKYNTYTMTGAQFATEIIKAIEGEAYDNDRSQVELIMIQLFNSYGTPAFLELHSPSTGRTYGISREIDMTHNALILDIAARTLD